MKLSENKNWDAAMKIGGSIVLFFLGQKVLANQRKKGAEGDMDNNPNSGYAASLKQAMNPSGFRWMKDIDGSNKEAIMQVASQISNLDEVAKYYKGLTVGGSLYDDLQGSLSPDEYQKFLSLASKGKTGSWFHQKESTNVPANRWIVTIKEANVRRTPVYLWPHAVLTNVVKLVPAGYKLGASTGKYAYDEKAKVLFVEFWTFTTKGEKKTYFVAKSQVEFLTLDELSKREKNGKLPMQVLEGLGDIQESPQQEVISKETAIVYDEKFNHIGLIPKNTIMGFPIMTLDTGKGSFIQFQTVQGAKRWIDKEMAEIRDRKI